jgi:hypothetical protein
MPWSASLNSWPTTKAQLSFLTGITTYLRPGEPEVWIRTLQQHIGKRLIMASDATPTASSNHSEICHMPAFRKVRT